MFRYLVELIVLLLFFAAVRSILTWMVRLFAATLQAPRTEAREESSMSSAGELHKDPVCGTFVPVSGFRRVVGKETLYFCSAECRDRYMVPSSF